jgi:hypothetical protein
MGRLPAWSLTLALGLLIALPAWAEDFLFRGQWETQWPSGKYVGIVLIDGERRVTVDSPNDQGRPAKFFGYVSEMAGNKLAFIVTDRAGVAATHCDIRSNELLHCHNVRADGTRSVNFLMVKVGPGPEKLTRVSP